VILRRISRFARLRAGLIGCCIVVAALAVASCSGTARAAGSSGRAGHPARVNRVRVLAAGDPFGACEQRIERGPHDLRALAIVGASFTAGVGPDNPALSWAADLARKLRWNTVVYGVPGAGYVRTGTDGLGPMKRMLDVERLPGLAPALVIVQAGHDDDGVPARAEGRQVRQAIDLVRADAPRARIALVTVFAPPSGPVSRALSQADRAIVTAARAADPHVIIMDPLTGHWKFPRARDGLHPTAAGDAWIARRVASILRAHGIAAAASTVRTGVVCDVSVRAKAVLPRSVVAPAARQRSGCLRLGSRA
jgi:lysophospholipase L1-like esterase